MIGSDLEYWIFINLPMQNLFLPLLQLECLGPNRGPLPLIKLSRWVDYPKAKQREKQMWMAFERAW
jgi:hypothetical protein